MAYDSTEDDDDFEEDEDTSEPQDWMERIALALEEHCGLDLGDLEQCENDPDEFANLVEVAARNAKNRKKKAKARKVRMSQRAHRRRIDPRLTGDDRVVAAFHQIVGDGD